MSQPNGEQPEAVYTPGSAHVPAQVPAQATAPQTETMIMPSATPAFPAGQPAPAYPVSAAPASAVPGGQPAYPVSAVPGQPAAAYPAAVYPPAAYPVSAVPGAGPEYGGLPVSALPYGYPQMAQKPKKTGIIVLSIVTGLLVLATGTLSALFFVESTERKSADKLVAEQKAAIEAETTRAKDLDTQLQGSKAEVQKLTQEIAGAKSKTEDVTKEKEALAACFRAMEQYFISQSKANQTALQTACNEAERYY
jgi:flagellar basal body-associated protein FliL